MDPGGRPGDAERSADLVVVIEDRRRHAGDPFLVLLVVEGVATAANPRQLLPQIDPGGDRTRGEGLEWLPGHDFRDDALLGEGEHRLAAPVV